MADAQMVFGRDVIFSMLVGSTYLPILCATDCTYTCAPEEIEKTGPNSGGVRQKMRRLEEHSSTITGLTPILNGDVVSFFYMLQVGIRRVDQTFKMLFDDDNGNTVELGGVGLIGSQSINGPAADFSTGTIEIWWNQAPDINFISGGGSSGSVIPGGDKQIQLPLYLTGAEGDTSVTDVLLDAVGVSILGVFREGVQYDQVSGTPGNRQFQFSGGDIIFQNAFNTGGEGVMVLYEL